MPIPILAALGAVKMGFALWKWIAIAIAVAALVGAVWYAKSTYDDSRRREGADAQVKIMQPKIDRLTIERDVHLANLEQAERVNKELVETNKLTVALYQEQERALADATDLSRRAQEQARRTMILVAERTKSHEARIVELLRRSQAPIQVGENVCEEGDAIARSVYRERLRNR